MSLYYPSVVNGTQDDVQDGDNQRVIDQEFLKDFIQYARYTCAPEITAESAEVLVQGYLLMRGMGGSSTQSGSGTGYSGAGSKTISATPRQLESLIRLSQALAKMRLSDVVLKSDVEEAIRLMRVATQAAATDPRTGTIDMDMISTGRSSLDRDAIARLSEELLKLFEARKGETLSLHAIRQAIERVSGDNSLTVEDIEEALRDVPDNVAVFIERTKNVSIRA